MTPLPRLQPSARLVPGPADGPATERRRVPVAFRGSLERRRPASPLAAEAGPLLPPGCRSEAFAEDLADETAAAAAGTAAPRGRRLRWLGLPMLVLGLGASLGWSGLPGL